MFVIRALLVHRDGVKNSRGKRTIASCLHKAVGDASTETINRSAKNGIDRKLPRCKSDRHDRRDVPTTERHLNSKRLAYAPRMFVAQWR